MYCFDKMYGMPKNDVFNIRNNYISTYAICTVLEISLYNLNLILNYLYN